MQLFFSYARPDRSRVDSLVIQLRQATGIEVWLDSDLVGGWPWWDKILGQLRSCDAVLAAVSRASVNSQACRAERDYAAKNRGGSGLKSHCVGLRTYEKTRDCYARDNSR